MARMGRDSMTAALIYQYKSAEADRSIADHMDAQLRKARKKKPKKPGPEMTTTGRPESWRGRALGPSRDAGIATKKAQAEDYASDLRLWVEGDGNRTRTVSLGSASSRPFALTHRESESLPLTCWSDRESQLIPARCGTFVARRPLLPYLVTPRRCQVSSGVYEGGVGMHRCARMCDPLDPSVGPSSDLSASHTTACCDDVDGLRSCRRPRTERDSEFGSRAA